MKKILLGILSIILLSGCGEKMFNTPTKKVEMFFQNYQTLSKDVIEQLNKVVNEEENFNADQRLAYKELMKKHYQELKYEIKDEKLKYLFFECFGKKEYDVKKLYNESDKIYDILKLIQINNV